MKDKIISVFMCLILLGIVGALFIGLNDIVGNFDPKKDAGLIIYGDTIASKYSPIVENDKIYLTVATIEQFIDDKIFYDKSTQKVIITTQDAVYKYKVGDNIASKNLKEFDAKSSCKIVNNNVYVDMNLVKDIYDIKCEYDAQTNTISIDDLQTSGIELNYNDVKLYSNINTKSDIIETLDTTNTVTVYTESLKHNRWYKVKSDSGKIGYIEKGAVTVHTKEEQEQENKAENNSKDKIIMFWQYGSNLDTLGDKEVGVDVVSPTWFSLSDGDGSVEINFSRDYYNKAKNNGYKIWPIITNGLSNPNVNSKEITSEIMNNEEKRENAIRNIVDIIKTYDLDGINIDFEAMIENDKYMYTQFMRELYPVVKETGAKLSVDIYFSGDIDRKGIGQACDYVILMGYDQRGDWAKEPGSISEIEWAEKNVKSLIEDSNIPEYKIILGIPFYTRLWKVLGDGSFSTNVYSMNNSKEFVNQYNLTPTLDTKSGQNYVETVMGGITYKLWIEDEDSIARRADSILRLNIAGVSAWQRGFETEEVWKVLYEKLKK